ncbi:hypothetical protein [Proteiniclasticum sp. QWL-01]|uniref:hypothetical protein n=1 Tax=Proteiniclasticum sp. QWL-01 TaxID=3036945 RepID=UPI0021FEB3CA|nr:hypothetical protein [Proteiniclasticum sp. QWL-01]UUM11007.1 hypothetical protein NQU17_10065 [Clostridiaceae bacterium HFYG-1003]WFF72336.1 hypothetical protein P6M73_13750 [Proteiniclasticum sp. QWL-01]
MSRTAARTAGIEVTMNQKHLKMFFEHYGIAFWILYLLFPFFLNKALPDPAYSLILMLLLGGYLTVMYYAYATFATNRQFVIDAASLVIGVSVLSAFSMFRSSASTALDLTMYLVLSMTFAPTALRLETHKTRSKAKGKA